tara:strand:- start:369 stop:2087 length:1719 start_codon:yes stop_codon:yes gene_type:complete
MANLPIINNLRVVPRDAEFLDRKTGARGEIFYDKDNNTIRLYDSQIVGGLPLARGDLTNVTNAVFAAKATAAGVGGSQGSGSIEVSQTAPSTPEEGTIWFNSSNGTLYVYINDGDSNQWVQPVLGYPAIPSNLQDLSNVTITSPSADQVLKWNGSAWINAAAPAAGLDQAAVRSSISVGTEGTAAGDGAVSYDNGTGVFTYTPPLLNSLTVSGNLDMGSNDITTTGKIYYANVFATEGDLPSATDYHGMFAHVHGTGAAYFAHAGAWTKLANNATTLAGYGITDAATSAQGAKADSALQNLSTTSITALSDVSTNAPGANQILKWNGSEWAPASDAVGSGAITATIAAATQDNPVVISTSSAHGFYEGQPVTIAGVAGMTELNGNEYYANVTSTLDFSLYSDAALTTTVNGTGFTAYISGGTATGGAVAAEIGNFVFTGSNIDTSDSASISVTPLVTMQSDLRVENDLIVDNLLTAEQFVVTNFSTTNLTVSDTLSVKTIAQTDTGTPQITSSSTLVLNTQDGVRVTGAPFRLPSFTTVEKNALSPGNGDMIYDSTLNKAQVYENGSWASLV